MRNSTYWRERFAQLEQSQNRRGTECFAEIEQQYRGAMKEIEKQIAVWYQRFADNNEIGLSEARRLLRNKELDELKWDVNQYIRRGKENAVTGEWIEQLENASARYHISRLEALKLHTQQSLEVMFGNQMDSIDSTMREIYLEGIQQTAFEIQKGVGVGWDFASVDERRIEKVINKPWAADGKNFSSRIWGNRRKLVNELHTELTKGIILGRDPQKTIDAIAKEMNTSKNVTGRLIMTEQAYFSEEAKKDAFRDLDVEMYEIVATLDRRTSEICQEMDGRRFPMSQWETGVTAPPFHVWCRSTTVPAFNDEFDEIGQRAARGEDGKTYHVPENMTYKEWKKSFVESSDKSGLQEVKNDGTMKTENPKTFKQLSEDDFKAIKQPITQAERKIIYGKTHYSGYINSSNARKMNALLREGKELPADYRKIELTLKGVIGRHQLPDDLLVTRYVAADALEGMFGVSVPQYKLTMKVDDFWKQIEELPMLLGSGKVYTEKGFLSTSGVMDKNVMNNKVVKLIIKAPKGTHSYVTTNYKESEIIFDENTTLYLKNAYIENLRQSGWKIVLECEIR